MDSLFSVFRAERIVLRALRGEKLFSLEEQAIFIGDEPFCRRDASIERDGGVALHAGTSLSPPRSLAVALRFGS
jgi:hypothetical protein